MGIHSGDRQDPNWLAVWWGLRYEYRQQIELAVIDMYDRYGAAAYGIARNSARARGGAEHRRRYLDWGLFHVEPEFLPWWRRYARALKQRNAALKSTPSPAALAPWERELAEAGEVITRMLKLCGYVVFRGGSSSGKARRRTDVLAEMITHMKTTSGVIYGLTVDGSKGPAYRMKMGGVLIARECGKPLALVRTWYKRSVRLRTWDRMAVPLPFNVIKYYLRGPYFVPADADTEAGLARFRLQLENDLIDLAAQSYDDMGQERPANLVKRADSGESSIGAEIAAAS